MRFDLEGEAVDRDHPDFLTRSQIDGAVSGRFARSVHARPAMVDGAPGIVVTVHASVPALGLGGPAVELDVAGHAVEEEPS